MDAVDRLREYAGDGTALGDDVAEVLDELEQTRADLAAAESTILAWEDPATRATLTDPTSGDYGPVPYPGRPSW